jgi:DeoR family transcriptional regulator of aga operon
MEKTGPKSPQVNFGNNHEMLIDERRQHILELIQEHGRVLVGELSSALKISQITIRKDLDYLQSKGLIQRSHGGALKIQSSALIDPTLQEIHLSVHSQKTTWKRCMQIFCFSA